MSGEFLSSRLLGRLMYADKTVLFSLGGLRVTKQLRLAFLELLL